MVVRITKYPLISMILLFLLLLLAGCSGYSYDKAEQHMKNDFARGYRSSTEGEFNYSDVSTNMEFSKGRYLNLEGQVVEKLSPSDKIGHILVATKPGKNGSFDGDIVLINIPAGNKQDFSKGDKIGASVIVEGLYYEGIPIINQKVYPQLTALGIELE
jgi:hypothetical protein